MRCTSSCTSRTVRAELGLQAFRACTASASRSFLSISSPSLFRTSTSLISTLSSFCRAFCCASSDRDSDAIRRIGHALFLSPVKDRVAEQRSEDFWRTERVNSVEWEANELTSCAIEFVALAMWECAVRMGQVGRLEGRGILIAEETTRTSSFRSIVFKGAVWLRVSLKRCSLNQEWVREWV